VDINPNKEMTPDELFNIIESLINNLKRHPKLLTFVELRQNVKKSKEAREAFLELVKTKRIRVRPGMKDKLIEIIKK